MQHFAKRERAARAMVREGRSETPGGRIPAAISISPGNYRAPLRAEKAAEVPGPRPAETHRNTYTLLHVTVITVQHIIGRFLRLSGGDYNEALITPQFREPALKVRRLVFDHRRRNAGFSA